MSIKAMTWAFDRQLSGNEKVVLLALADFANDDGLCWPAIPKIAQKACLSVRTVQRIILSLVDQEYLSFDRRSSERDVPISSMYRLHLFEGGDGDNLSPYGDTYCHQGGDTVVTTNEPSIEPSLEKNKHARVDSKKQTSSKPSRVPDGYFPSDATIAVLQGEGFDYPEVRSQINQFLDYWRAVPGAKGLKLDWESTFRNWVRNSRKFNRNAASSKPNSIADSFAVIDAAIAQRERELFGDEGGAGFSGEGLKLVS